jgi:TetR/AcrR family transcriptional regulator
LFEKIEAALRQTLREGAADSATPSVDAQIKASWLMAFTQGRLQQYARSGFKRSVLTHLDACLALMA